MKKYRLAIVAVALIVLGSCLSAPPPADPFDGIIDFINDASIEALVEQSHNPMVFDAELVVRSGDIELLWTGLRSSGFELSPAGYFVEPVQPGDHRRLADSFDMRAFFSPEAGFPSEARWIVADSSAGRILLLLGEFRNGLPTIYGVSRVES